MNFVSYVQKISFSCETMGTRTRFEKEAKGNPEMTYFQWRGRKFNHWGV